MSEQRAVPKLAEGARAPEALNTNIGEIDASQERDQTVHHKIAEMFVNDHAGNVPAEDRDFLISTVSVEVRQVLNQADATNADKVKAFEALIWKLRGDKDGRGEQTQPTEIITTYDRPVNRHEAHTVAPRPEGVPTTEEAEAIREEAETNKSKYTLRQKARMVLGLPSLTIMTLAARENRFVRHEDETEETYDKRMKRHKWSGIVAATGVAAYFSYKAYAGWKGFDAGGASSSQEGLKPLPIEGDINSDGAIDAREQAIIDGFGYDPAQDSYNDEGKLKPNNWGAPIDGETPREVIDQGLEGWKDSPEQLATVMAETRLFPEFTTANIEEMAARMKGEPEFLNDSYNRLLEKINDPTTEMAEGYVQSGTYGSYFATMENGDALISYDDVVKEDDETIILTFKGPNGEEHTVEMKKNCKLQPIHRNPTPVVIAPMYNETGGAAAEYNEPTVVVTHENPGIGGPTPEEPAPELPEPELPVPEPPTPEEPIPEEPEPEPPTPLPEHKEWEDQVDTEMDPLGVTELTEDFATAGNGTGSPSLDGTESIGSGNTDVVVEDATVGTGGGRDESTGDTGTDAAEADRDQSHDSATDEATEATDDAAGTAEEPVAGRVE
ncbi:MAG: Mixed-linked glucanase [Candidatus Saccharibacteria bacterium GW2011_GWC2_48_9]|nr:MAG: Mixed-linked glucanase [Candidatus Saccharibacteria bacterium GW2011_GWC2_48_9]HCH34536.1 hypothetical protein [Candidatus Saccharibacteria bacterium]